MSNETTRDTILDPIAKKKRDTKLTEKKEKFLELYIEHADDPAGCWVSAGHSPNNAGHESRRWLRDNYKKVQDRIYDKIGGHVPFAIAGIVELAKTARQESVKLKCYQDILSRAGYDKALEIITTEKKAADMSAEDIEKELDILISKANTQTEEKGQCH